MLEKIAPPGTWRHRILQLITSGGATLFREGPFPFLRTTFYQINNYWALQTAYQRWLRQNTPRRDRLTQQRNQAQAFSYRPLISLITPVYNPPPDILRAALESVLIQSYDHWELCLVDGASTRAGVRETLSEYAQKDSRIHLQTLPANLGISGNSNAALQMAQGEFIQLLDHDDTLTPDALFEIVQHLNQHPDIDLLYFDEDKLSENGQIRRSAIFKPRWSPDLLLSANYLSHSVIRRSLVLEAGGFNPEMDGAQDWDLAFRIIERTNHIAHLPKVLYNWRQVTGSTAIFASAKRGVLDAQIRAVSNHLNRRGLKNVKGTILPSGILHFSWAISGDKISILAPVNYSSKLTQWVKTLLSKLQYPNFELLLIGENLPSSSDPRVRLINASPADFHLEVKGLSPLLLFLTPGLTPLAPVWIEELARWAERPEIGGVGAKLMLPNGMVENAGYVFSQEGQAYSVFRGASQNANSASGSADWYRNYLAVSGDCFMMRREVFEEVGGFERYTGPESLGEICLRVVQHGYRIVYTPFARLQWTKASPRLPSLQINPEHLQTWGGDPYLNPNLKPPRFLP